MSGWVVLLVTFDFVSFFLLVLPFEVFNNTHTHTAGFVKNDCVKSFSFFRRRALLSPFNVFEFLFHIFLKCLSGSFHCSKTFFVFAIWFMTRTHRLFTAHSLYWKSETKKKEKSTPLSRVDHNRIPQGWPTCIGINTTTTDHQRAAAFHNEHAETINCTACISQSWHLVLNDWHENASTACKIHQEEKSWNRKCTSN